MPSSAPLSRDPAAVVWSTGRQAARVVLLLGLALALLSGVGCGRIKDDKRAMLLESATSGYRQSIRWGYYEAAVGFLHPDERTDLDFEALSNVRVTSYEVVVPAVIGDGDQAVQVVQIEYVLNDRQTVKRVADRQDWRYDAERNSWWLHSGLPKFAK